MSQNGLSVHLSLFDSLISVVWKTSQADSEMVLGAKSYGALMTAMHKSGKWQKGLGEHRCLKWGWVGCWNRDLWKKTPTYLPQEHTPDPPKTTCLFLFHIMDMCNLWYILVRYVPEVCGLELFDFECWTLDDVLEGDGWVGCVGLRWFGLLLGCFG